MRLKAMAVVVAVVTITALAGCSGAPSEILGREVITGSGNLASESRPVVGFTAVSLEGVGTVVIEQGDEESLLIEADDNILEHLKAEVVDGVLVLGFQGDALAFSFHPVKGITFRVKARTLDGIGLAGAGTVKTGSLIGDSLRVEGTGAGLVQIESFSGQRLTVDLDGGVGMTVAGSVESQRVEIQGAGNYTADELQSLTAAVTIDGAGNARVWVEDGLHVSITGAGAVQYKGTPQVTKDITGLGTVTALGS